MAYFAAHNLPWVGAFSFTRETIAHGAAGARVGGFGGLVVEFIVGKGAAVRALRISTGEVSRNTNRKKAVTPYDL